MKEKKNFRKYVIGFWLMMGIGITSVVILFALVGNGKLGFMPSFDDLENPESNLASEIYSADSIMLGRYFYKENRTYTHYNQISTNVVHALVATEDVRFYDHSGIDLIGLGRVFKGIVAGDKSSGGGSTISQQLAKLLFPRERMSNPVKLALRKFREWVIAVKLEKSYTKEEIMTMYLNKFDFLNLAVGIHSASQIYFNTTPDSLKIHEAAMLVGMCKNPSYFNPLRRPKLVTGRRNVVFSQMKKYGFITAQQLDSLKKMPLGLDYQKVDFKSGLAPYFREYLRTALNTGKPKRKDYASWQTQKYLEDSVEWETNPMYGWCKKNFKPDGSHYDIYSDGLKIYTTIDSRMQRYAEEAVVEHLSSDLQPTFMKKMKDELENPPFSNDLDSAAVESLLDRIIRQSERYRVLKNRKWKFKKIKANFEKPTEMTVFTWKGERDTVMTPLDSIRHYLSYMRSSFISMEPATGHIKAYVGGPNYKHFMYDMARIGKRQVGSTVKPFLYTLAMQNGLSPCTKVPNVPVSFDQANGTTWTAKNAGSKDPDAGKMVTLKWGLAHSVNQISAWVLKQFNPKSVVRIMKKMGVRSPIDPVPSMILGTSDISLYEMIGAYGAFANKGVYTQPIMVTRIEDKNGNVIARFQPHRHDAIDENTAYLMINLLRGVVDTGSGGRLRWHPVYGGLRGPIGGKTGTTQNHSDGWFMGITPQLVGGAWTGADLRSIHFEDLKFGQGANMALPIYGRFMKKVYADESLPYSQKIKFEAPEGFILNLNCDEVNQNNNTGGGDDNTEEEEFF
ncbi:penicillin-binding protein [Prolixibacteraceae bacterium JC049]|nr:penicillin-binding protein [Prolixibacteraceae bacterium JC049]